MFKNRLLLAYIPLIFCWIIDFLIKGWFAESAFNYSSAFLNLAYVENHGIVLGGFKELPLLLRSVFLCTTGVAIVAAFPVLMNIVVLRSYKTILGLSLIFSGILGNITDRVVHGYVIDFIFFKTPFFTTPAFNLADAVQWVGYLMFFGGVMSELNHHFPENDKRSSGWINPPYQLRFSIMLSVMFLGFGVTFLMFSFTFLKFGLLELGVSQRRADQYLNYYLVTSAIIICLSTLVTFLIGKILSHRIAGPIYAIKAYVADTLQGKSRVLALREHDHLKDLEAPLTQLNKEHCDLKSEKSAA